ncbi:hypothetical protein ScPMuIL_010549 [Solemya velum]
MNLLPQSHTEFHSPGYWDQFFKKRGTKAFEWYGDYPELCGVLHKYIKPVDPILVVGCGNSRLSEDLYDVGCRNIVNIDISDTVVRQMKEKNRNLRPLMSFTKMDIMQMEYSDGGFGVALDKGTLDALMVDDSEQVVSDINKMFQEIGRVLKLGGRYICITLLQDHILKKVLEYFPSQGWPVRIHKIHTEESENSEKEFHMPVFALVCTKFKSMPNMKPILEVSNFEDKVQRFETVEKIKSVVKEMQYYAIMRQQLSKRSLVGEQVSLSLYSDVSSSPRYTLHIVDSLVKSPNSFAIFIVPQGRETEWMFSTDTGRIQLSKSAGFERLIVASLNRNHHYENLDAIKTELSSKVMELVPPTFKMGRQVPFLSVGDNIGHRTMVHQGTSARSGDYVVEDVEADGGTMFRRLIFLSNPNVIQSEARLKADSTKKKGKKKLRYLIDKSYLACQHHVAMVAGLAFVQDFQKHFESELTLVLVGLGGGGLASFIHQHFPKVILGVIDIDPAVVTIATDWFGFQPDERMKVHVADGLEYIEKYTNDEKKHHAVMMDVDSKDLTVGMSCPPEPFIQTNILEAVRNMLHPGGVFILNLACRNEDLKKTVLERIRTIFESVYVKDLEGEVNAVVYAIAGDLKSSQDLGSADPTPGGATAEKHLTDVKSNIKLLESSVKRQQCSAEADLAEMVQDLTVI